MRKKYTVNWQSHKAKGNVIESGKTLVIKTDSPTSMFASVILKKYKKSGPRTWRGTPVMIAQEDPKAVDGVLEMKLQFKKNYKLQGIPEGKYMLRTWIVDPKEFSSRMYYDKFEII